jgi:hypothetical protein
MALNSCKRSTIGRTDIYSLFKKVSFSLGYALSNIIEIPYLIIDKQ